MQFTPEVALAINVVFMALFAFSLGYLYFGLLNPISNRAVVMPPGDALPVIIIAVIVYGAVFALMDHFVPFPQQYKGASVFQLDLVAFLATFATGLGLGFWKPMVR